MFQEWANWFDAHRRAVAILVAVVTAAALAGTARLQFDDLPRTTFRSNDADFQRLEEVFHQFGADDSSCVLLVEADEIYKPENIVALRKLIAEVRAVPGIVDVQSLADLVTFPKRGGSKTLGKLLKPVPTTPYSLLPEVPADGGAPTEAACLAARETALKHPLAKGQLLSDDSKATLVVARTADDQTAIRQLAPIVERLNAACAATEQAGNLHVRLTGLVPIRVEIFQSVRRESARAVFVGGILTVVMAAFMFRRPAAVAIVCSGALLGAAWAVGGMGLIGEKMNILTTVLPTLVMVIGFTDAVHLMIDIRRHRAAGATPREAAHDAVRHLGMPCLLCALSTVVGFGSLSLARIEIIQRFGLICGLGVALALAAVFLTVPLLSSTRLGLKVHSAPGLDMPQRIATTFEPLVRWIVGHARMTATLGIAATALMACSIFVLVPSSQTTEALPTHSPAFQAVKQLDKSFGGSGSAQILVECDAPLEITSPAALAAIEEAQASAGVHSDVRNPTSIVNLLRSLPGDGKSLAQQAELLHWVPQETLRHYVRPDLRRALIRLRLQDVGSSVHNVTFDELRRGFTELEAKHPGVHFYLTGTAVISARNLNQMIGDLAPSFGSAALAILVVMAIGFRSLRLGVISLVPNLFPMALTATFLVLTGRPLSMTAVIVFSICLGMAVDDTIHFVNRFQRELKVDNDVQAAVLRSYRDVGSAMIMTSLVLFVGFGSLFVSEMPPTRLFALLSCLTIVSALVGELLIQPAMLVCFAKQLQPAAGEERQPSLTAGGFRGADSIEAAHSR